MSDDVEVFEVVVVGDGCSHLRQRNEHRPEDGIIGDCYRTAIACLLGCSDPSEVPHFTCLAMIDNGDGWDADRLARIWLRDNRDLDLAWVDIEAAQQTTAPYIVSVHSKRGPWRHLVIACGEVVVHDPSGLGYCLSDRADDAAIVLTRPYAPDPDDLLREWRQLSATAATVTDPGPDSEPTAESGPPPRNATNNAASLTTWAGRGVSRAGESDTHPSSACAGVESESGAPRMGPTASQ